MREIRRDDRNRLRRPCVAVSTLLAGALVFAILPRAAYGWGATGHRAVGRIAEKHLSGEAKRAVEKLLGRETLAEVATWPDDIRSDPKWQISQVWHFVTIEDGETYKKTERGRLPPRDIIEAIEYFEDILRKPAADWDDPKTAKQDKVIALKWIVHLVGDVHQPLHVGRGVDRGGNTIEVKWFGKESNLHSVWDDGMIDATKLSFSELAQFADKASDAEVVKWQESTVLDWVQESITCREKAYIPPGPEVGDSYRYSYENLPVVKERLAQAGVRLAGLLNDVFKGKSANEVGRIKKDQRGTKKDRRG